MKRITLSLILILLASVSQAAVTVRYFSTSAAGAGDGTTWADRAQLHNAGTWSTVITAFDFGGSDGLEARIGPGTHTISTNALATGLFSVAAPTAANPLTLVGCDSSGSVIEPPDLNWTSDMAVWSDTTLPVIATTTDIGTITFGTGFLRCRMLKFTASSRTAAIVLCGFGQAYDWCQFVNSTANTAAVGVDVNGGGQGIANCYIEMSGASYNCGVLAGNGAVIDNCRIKGVAGSSGDRRGIEFDGTNETIAIIGTTIYNNGGYAIASASTDTSQRMNISRCVLADNVGGILTASTASQIRLWNVSNCSITGNTAPGLDAQSAGRVDVRNSRFRDNTTANYQNLGNYNVYGVYTTDSDDATEYVDPATDDFRIKSGATIHGMGFGVSEQASGSNTITPINGSIPGL